MRALFEVVFVYLVLSYNFDELKDYMITTTARKLEKGDFLQRFAVYIRDPWNVLDVFSQFWATLTILMYFIVIDLGVLIHIGDWPPRNPKEVWYGQGPMNGGWYFNVVACGLGGEFFFFFNLIFVGARVFKYYQFHSGVSLYRQKE